MGCGGESAFGQESTIPHPSRFLISEIKQIFLSTNLASLLVFEKEAAGPTLGKFLAPSMRLPSRDIWLPEFSQAEQPPWHRNGLAARSPLLVACWHREGIWGDIPSRCRNHLFQGSSLFLPCSSLAAKLCFSLVEGKDTSGWADELQDQVSPPVCTRQTSLLSTKCYLGILPIGSDVCLTLRTVCVGECLFGTPYGSSFLEDLWQFCLLVCESIFHLCDWYLCYLL